MWKRRVLNEYGVDYTHDETWKELAKDLFQADMINLNKVWIDGITYGKLLKECLSNHDYITKFLDRNRATCYIFPPAVTGLEDAKEYVIREYGGSYAYQYVYNRFDKHKNYILRDEERVMKTIKYSTREFAIIANAIYQIENHDDDPIYSIMEYCKFSDSDLNIWYHL
uniref:Uncharacterized protein n=1 Tax=Pithovirus LCPAC401 TaxID=2506595 RepID=A0A481ZCY4_9VIRU|nr:MAG: uncharacterized protein LCPAC401_01690 [Pithovirus LCPAC401]